MLDDVVGLGDVARRVEYCVAQATMVQMRWTLDDVAGDTCPCRLESAFGAAGVLTPHCQLETLRPFHNNALLVAESSRVAPPTWGLHSSAFQLNVCTFC
jgi:hypothetical protein